MQNSTLERITHSGHLNSPATGREECRIPQGKGPAAKECFDPALIDRVGRTLATASYPALRNLQIEIERGVVVLWGRVPTYHQKQLAQAMVQQVDGVRGIANGIEVSCCR